MISDPDSPCYLSPQGQYQRGRGQRRGTFFAGNRLSLVLVCVLLSAATVPLAAAQKTAAAHVERGYELLAQARREIQDRRRDQLLVAASKAFSHAYQLAGPRTKAQVLIGAAQGYLLMKRPPTRDRDQKLRLYLATKKFSAELPKSSSVSDQARSTWMSRSPGR